MIVFRNAGVVPIEAFTTFGMSAKPGSTNPIGKFGTGLKYAVAVTLRLGGTFKLWRGTTEYEFYTREEDFRGKTFAKVRMRKRDSVLGKWRYEALPFTTELGKHWKPWMAFRELEANVRDEQDGRSDKCDSEWVLNHIGDEIDAHSTVILIDCPEIEEAFDNIDDVFLPEDREPIFEGEHMRVYEGGSGHVFYRGMRVTDLRKPSLYTYEMKRVYLTEDRTSQYPFLDNSNMMQDLMACDNRDIVRNVVDRAADHHEESFDWDSKKPRVSSAWYPALSRSGLSSRFSTMRDNLHFGISSDEEVEVMLEAREWERVMGALHDRGDPLFDKIKEQLVDAGWRETIPASFEADEIAAAVEEDA